MNQKNKPFGLKELVNPLAVEEFIEKHWLPNVPAVIHSSLDRFKEFSSLQKLLSLKEFAPHYYGRVSMIHPDGSATDVQSGSEALPYLDKGYTVYFRHIQNHFPEIRGVLDQLASDLSMPPNQFTAEIFTSSGLSGVPFHSDYDLNMSLLLSGERKEWTYAKNDSISNQTGICMPADRDQIEPKQMEYLTDVPLPTEMPADSVTGILRPGDLIFMPRGWWHTTHSVGECLCVNFVMKGPHWAHLLSIALEKELVADSQWREYPYWVAVKGEQREVAVKKLAGLIKNLKDSFSEMSAHDLAEKYIQKYLND